MDILLSNPCHTFCRHNDHKDDICQSIVLVVITHAESTSPKKKFDILIKKKDPICYNIFACHCTQVLFISFFDSLLCAKQPEDFFVIIILPNSSFSLLCLKHRIGNSTTALLIIQTIIDASVPSLNEYHKTFFFGLFIFSSSLPLPLLFLPNANFTFYRNKNRIQCFTTRRAPVQLHIERKTLCASIIQGPSDSDCVYTLIAAR